jgi:phage terminase large subunit
MQTTKVFSKNIAAYNQKESLIINQGGTSSSKTYSILQLLFLIAYYSTRALVISVVSYAFPHLRLGAIRDFDNILIGEGIIPGDICNKTEMIYRIGNSVIEFFGTENLGKVHGPRRDILFINEANNIKYDIYTQLLIRTRECVFLDYNPTQSFWVHEEVMPSFKHQFIKSTYLDNNFLNENTIKQIEGRRKNANWWRVYGEGETGILEGAIFTNWKFGVFDMALPFTFGMDFGFNDPDTLIKVAIDTKNKIIYADEKLYKSGNSSAQLKLWVTMHCSKDDLIIADCADARMIAELKADFNIYPVNKAKWTVAEALKMMQSFQFVITETSYNLSKEMNNYVWDDKKAGVPIDAFNHCIDPIRYVYVRHVSNSTGPSFGFKSI